MSFKLVSVYLTIFSLQHCVGETTAQVFRLDTNVETFKSDIKVEFVHTVIVCERKEHVDDMVITTNSTVGPDESIVRIVNCPLSNKKGNIFETYKIRLRSVDKVILEDVDEDLEPSHFSDLNIKSLSVTFRAENSGNASDAYSRRNITFIENMPILNELELVNLIPGPLPKNKIKKLVLKNGKTVPRGITVGQDSAVEDLTLDAWDLSEAPRGWLWNCCQHLKILNQPNLREEQVELVLKDIVSDLVELTIRDCYLDKMDTYLDGANKLEKLDLTNNQLHDFLVKTQLPSLQELVLFHNHIFGSALIATALQNQPKLRVAILDSNPYLDMCDEQGYVVKAFDKYSIRHQPLTGRKMSLQNIEVISLRNSVTHSLCMEKMVLPSLTYLDIGDSLFDKLQLLGLPVTSRPYTINVSGNPIVDFPFEKAEYDRVVGLGHMVTIEGLNYKMDCDCHGAWLGRALREGALAARGVRCAGGGAPAEVPVEAMACKKQRCAEVCDCRSKENSTATAATCQSGLEDLPSALIHLLHGSDPEIDVEMLDLSDNRITRLNETAIEAIFSKDSRVVKLDANPILCDCDNEAFISALQAHKSKIMDYPTLSCSGASTHLLRDVHPPHLCSRPLHQRLWFTALLAAAGAAVGLLALAASVYYRFRSEIKIYLYARGLCLCCVKETEIDSQREFDAFISFSHKDEEFIRDEFLPILDKDYKICIHYRDWMAGEMIPNQIVKSVESSRRTIIILSRNFIESIWGLLEFKTAHISALREGRVRVIIIVLDDIIDDKEMDLELRNYLKTNTYIKWGDEWFWRKLRYALPHKDRGEKIGKKSVERSQDSGLELESVGTPVQDSSGTPVQDSSGTPVQDSSGTSVQDSVGKDSGNDSGCIDATNS